MNQTAHISLQKLSISKSVETKVTGSAVTCLARPAHSTSDFSLRFPPRPSAFPLPFGSFRVPLALLSAAVEGVLRIVAGTRNPFFQENAFFMKFPIFPAFSVACLLKSAQNLGSFVILLPALSYVCHHILCYPQAYPQERPRLSRFNGVNRT